MGNNLFLHFIKRYPFSITIVLTVLYLSFFRPPTLDIPRFPHLDKLVHFLMYGSISGVLWLEFFLNHRKSATYPLLHALIGAVLCPILLGGLIEIGQQHLTTYRGGDWLDFLSNTTGVLVASATAYFLLQKTKDRS